MKSKLFFIFLLAFLIRLIAINQSLWLDEGTTARVVKEYSNLEIITKFSPVDFHPPLYYLFIKIWTGFFGFSEIALRMPSVLFSLATGYVIYLIGGVWASLFFLFNPLIIYYSQEARQYMMVTFLLTSCLYVYIKSTKIFSPTSVETSVGKRDQQLLSSSKLEERSGNAQKNFVFFILCYGVLIILSLLTFYGSIFFIITILMYQYIKKEYKQFFITLFTILFSLLIISPLLYQQLVNAKDSLKIITNWSLVLGKANLKNLLLIPLKFAFGRISFYPKLIYYLVSGLWTVLVWYFVVRGGIKNKLFFMLMIGPLIIGLFFSFYSPLLQYFRFLYLIPIMSVLLTVATKTSINRFIIIIGFVILSLVYLLNPSFHREDWKRLAKSLSNKDTVYMILPSADALGYYRSDIKLEDLREIKYAKEKEIIVIPYVVDIYGFDYKKNLLDNNFKLINKITYRGLIKERWVLK